MASVRANQFFQVYDLFIPIAVLALAMLFALAVPRKSGFRKLKCKEIERRVISLPTMWLRGALMLEYADRWTSILSFGCSLIVIVMAMFDDPFIAEKAAIYSTIAVLAAVTQWVVQFRRGSIAYRRAYNGINAAVLDYVRRYIEPIDFASHDGGASANDGESREEALRTLVKLADEQERELAATFHEV